MRVRKNKYQKKRNNDTEEKNTTGNLLHTWSSGAMMPESCRDDSTILHDWQVRVQLPKKGFWEKSIHKSL